MKANPAPRMDESILRALPRARNAPERAAPARGPREAEARGGTLILVLLGGLACAVVAFAALYFSASPAVASLMQAAPTPTRSVNFARSDLLKPTFTASPAPTFTPTITPSPMPSATPGVAEVSIVADTPTPERAYAAPGNAYSGSKYILVDISEQQMYVYEADALIWNFVVSTGINNSTRTGLFAVQSKIPNAYGATWNIWMPNWLGIYWSGGLENGIHALPILPSGARLWAGFLGRPVSYGCVVLGEYDSELLYNWAELGTPVEIQW
ncbi:MAG: L,D-transpeptidase family protein [Chloroflexota bacterium]